MKNCLVMAGHILLIPLHSCFYHLPDFVNQVEVEAELFFILLIVICRGSERRQSNFDGDNCLASMSLEMEFLLLVFLLSFCKSIVCLGVLLAIAPLLPQVRF